VIGIVDYGVGNVRAFENVLRSQHIECIRLKVPSDFHEVSKIILPGVGAFDWAMDRLSDSGMRGALNAAVLSDRKPVLGVCVGMQMMARGSEEGSCSGLGWIDAKVVKLATRVKSPSVQIPHMGWNDITLLNRSSLFQGIVSPRFYFLHSYHMEFSQRDCILATSEHGMEITAAIQCGNIYGTQFHPEKSHEWGMILLRNFSEID
jgi:glutamine amidotransferase